RQLDEDESRAAVESVINELQARGLKDMGRVMGELKARYTGQMDFGKVSSIVKDLLG
ncbi:MAG: GatB/YqeY domain-containing protein, partial [Pseudomonadota bacterium]|nr:GatB/YqeY domain-containing protein [Pseudomonadota bacterium]